MHAGLAHIDAWIFDLDNSLYPHSCNLFELVDQRIGLYVQQLTGLDPVAARRVQKNYFHARVTADPQLVAAMDALPGRKFIFTNAGEDYARRVLDRLGLANAFDGLHDIHAMNYVPKPDPGAYAAICARHEIDPRRALFADDMVRNLKPARAIGITTLWIDNGSEQGPQAAPADPPEWVDHRTDSIAAWLHEVLGEKVA